MLDNQLRLHPDNLNLLLDPTFKRKPVGFYSITDKQKYVENDSERASLIALKEMDRAVEGVIEYDVPEYISDLDLKQGCLTYIDEHDLPKQSHLIEWLENHKDMCGDVDVVCSQQVAVDILKAPYTEQSALPWEIKLTRGPDGICYLEELSSSRIRYSEMNLIGKQQIFRQRAFKRYMTIKKGDHTRKGPPKDHGPAFYRVNKVELDSGTLIYQSETQAFDMNYNAIDFKVQLDGNYDLPSSSVRLNWWGNSYLAGSKTVLCGYVHEDDDDDHFISRLLSFDVENVKPRIVRDTRFDQEICVASLCTFIQFVKDLTANGRVASCVLRFEPGSKRVCVLETVNRRPSIVIPPGFHTQISATDETSSVEPSPRTPLEEPAWKEHIEEAMKTMSMQSNGTTLPRLRQISVNEASGKTIYQKRNSTLAELGIDGRVKITKFDADEDKYKPKPRKAKPATKDGEKVDEEMNWFHISIIFVFMAIAFIFLPMLLTRLEARKY